MHSDRLPRKLAAILYADVAGYSRLTGEDEDATHRTLSEYLDLMSETIAAGQGKVVHYAGDAVLADFPSVLDALTAAVQIQRKIGACNQALPDSRKVQFRIGVNLGDVIVDRDDIYGDGVNVAARLEALAEAGGICVSEAVRNAVGNRLSVVYEDLGEQTVKNIPEPVHAYRVLLDGEHRRPATAGSRPLWDWRLWQTLVVASAAFAMVAAAAIALWVLLGPSGPSEVAQAPDEDPERPAAIEPPPSTMPSIAVLPFDNMSGDEEQEYFSDGITEDLITDLSQISGLFVIARNSVFTYKGAPVKVQQVAKELGVRYVLEGSVRKAGNRVRINAQLVDATTGHHLWAERFDREMTDIFAVQDDITWHIVSALAVELAPEEKARRATEETSVPEAYDTLLRGLERLRRFTRENNAAARTLFEKAAALDPDYARAYADIAFTHSMDVFFGWTESPEKSLEAGLEAAREALALNDDVPQVHFTLSNLYDRMGRHEEAIAAAKRSVELEPGYADGYAQLGISLAWAGRPKESLEAIETAKRYNPLVPFFYRFNEGHALFMLGRYEEAIAAFEKVLERNPNFLLGHQYLAAAYAHAGRVDDAEWERLETLRLLPEFSISAERERRHYAREKDLEHYLDGLRLAGFAE